MRLASSTERTWRGCGDRDTPLAVEDAETGIPEEGVTGGSCDEGGSSVDSSMVGSIIVIWIVTRQTMQAAGKILPTA
ncbi:hypothetical protein GCM10008940_25850 [Microbulbifer agarilyticus]